jgi:hypothetical protein
MTDDKPIYKDHRGSVCDDMDFSGLSHLVWTLQSVSL